MINEIDAARDYLTEKGIMNPEVAIILGTGIGRLVDEMDIEVSLPYDEIPHFPESNLSFHKGSLIFGSLGGKKGIGDARQISLL